MLFVSYFAGAALFHTQIFFAKSAFFYVHLLLKLSAALIFSLMSFGNCEKHPDSLYRVDNKFSSVILPELMQNKPQICSLLLVIQFESRYIVFY